MRAAFGLGLGGFFLLVVGTFALNARAASSDNHDVRELSRLRSAGRLDEADIVAKRLRADPKAAIYVASYELYDRGRCEEAAALAPPASTDLLRSEELAFDIEVCRAARTDARDPAAAESLLGRATMLGDPFGWQAFASFGRFAESTEPDAGILQFLERKELNRYSHPLNEAMFQHLSRLDTLALSRILEAGIDPNVPVGIRRELPLQIVRSRSAANEAAAIEAARTLLEHGADPNRLAWHRDAKGELGDKGTDALEALLREAASRLDPVLIDYVGSVRVRHGNDESQLELRFRIGNSSDKPLGIDLWRAGDQLECGLNVVEFEFRPPHFEKWLKPSPAIIDGVSPTGIEIAPGEAREFLCQIDTREATANSEQRVVVYFNDGSKRASSSFHVYEGWTDEIKIPDFDSWK